MRFFHANALGSTVMTTGANGGWIGDLQLYPWGEAWVSAGSPGYDQHFAGMNQVDGAPLLYPAPFRRYSTPQGRWLSPDPLGGNIGNPQSLNRYAYVMNNPMSLIDPLGLGPQDGGANFCAIDPTRPACGNDVRNPPHPWGLDWNGFDYIGIPVYLYGYGWIPVEGSGGTRAVLFRPWIFCHQYDRCD
jgi:RHS repeat-associated protein